MKKTLVTMLLAASFLMPATLRAENWKGVPMIDSNCQAKFEGKPDEHTVGCALQCANGGYGIVVDKAFIRFDDQGNTLALKALKATKKKDAIRVTVDGKLVDGTIHVSKLAID